MESDQDEVSPSPIDFRNVDELGSQMSLSASLHDLNLQLEDSSDDEEFEARARELASQVEQERGNNSEIYTSTQHNVMPYPEDDGQFANDIGMNLLNECRRQQVQLKEYERANKDYENSIVELRREIARLSASLSSKESVEQEYKDENWDLQVKLDEANTRLNRHAQKSVNVASTDPNSRDYLKEIEALKSREAEYVSQITGITAKSNAQIDTLQEQLAKAEEQLFVLQSVPKPEIQTETVAVVEPRSIFDDVVLPPDFEQLPPESPIKDIGSTAHSDTTNSMVMQLQRQLYTVKQQLAKERAKNNSQREVDTPVKKSSNRKKHSSAKSRSTKPTFRGAHHSNDTQDATDDELSSFEEIEVEQFHQVGTGEVEDSVNPDISLQFGQEEFFESLQQNAVTSPELMPSASLATELPSQEDIADMALKLGLTLVDSEALEDLQRITTAPTDKDLEDICALRGYVPVHAEINKEMNEPSYQTVLRYAQNHNLEITPREELQKLKNREFTAKELSALAQKNSSVVLLGKDEYLGLIEQIERNEKILSKRDLANASVSARRDHFEAILKSPSKNIKSPSSSRISNTLSTLGYVPVPSEEYKRLVASQSVFTPSRTDIIRGAKAFGLATVPVDEYRDLIRRPAASSTTGSPVQRNSPKVDRVLEDDDVQVVPSHYLESLRTMVENPSKEDVLKAGEKHNLFIAEDTPEALENLAKKHGYRVTNKSSEEEFDSRIAELNIPTTPEAIIARGREFGLVDPLSDSEILERAHTLEPLDALVTRLASLGFISIARDDYSSLQRQLNEPTHEELDQRAAERGLRLSKHTAEEEFFIKAKELGVPTTDEGILLRSRELGLVDPLENQEIVSRALDLGLSHPLSEDEIRTKAYDLGLVNPVDDNEVISRAETLGYVPKPTDVEVTEHARKLGLVDPIDDSELVERARPLLNLALLEELVANHGHTSLPEKDLLELKRKATEPTLAEVSQLAASHSLIAVPETEYAEHVRKATEPTIEELALHAQTHNNRLTAKSIDEEFNETLANRGLVPILKAEHEEYVRKVTEPTIEEISAHAAKYNHRVTSKTIDEEFDDVLADRGIVPVSQVEYDDIVRRATKPSVEELYEHAKNYNHRVTSKSADEEFEDILATRGAVAVPHAEHSELVRKTTTPSLADLKSLADLVSAEIIDKNAHAELLRKADAPTSEEVVTLLAGRDQLPVPRSEYDEMQRKITSPSLDELRSHSESTEYRLVSLADIDSLKNPSIDDLRRHAARMDSVIVNLADFEESQRKATDPSIQELEELVSAKSHVLLPSAAHAELLARSTELKLKSEAENARTLQDVVKEANDYGLSALPTEDLNALQRKVTSPTIPELQSHAKSAGHIVLPKEEHVELKRAATEPTRDEVARHAASHGLPVSDAEIVSQALNLGLIHPLSPEQINESAKKNGLVSPPTEEDILSRARDLGLTDELSTDEVVERGLGLGLVRPLTNDEIALRARELGLKDVFSDKEITDRARELGLADPLQDDEILTHARVLGLTDPLSDDEIKDRARALGLTDKLSDDEIMERARALGLTDRLSDEEIKERARALGLVDKPSDDAIIAKANELGLRSPPDEDEIKTRAIDLGLSHPLSDDDIQQKAMDLGLVRPLSDDEITARAINLGLIHPLSESQIMDKARQLGLTDPLSNDEITTKAKQMGLDYPLDDNAVISKARNLGLVDAPHNEEIIAKAKELGLEYPLNDDEITAKATTLGLAKPLAKKEIIEEAKSLGLVEPLTESEIKEKAQKLNMFEPPTEDEFIERAKNLGLIDPPEDDEIVALARDLGMVDPLSDRDVLARAEELGHRAPPTDEEIKSKALEAGLIDASDRDAISKRATELGYISRDDKKEVTSAAKKIGLTERLSDADIVAQARSLGLTDQLSDQQIVAKGLSMGLVRPQTKEQILSEAKNYGYEKKLSNDEIRSAAAALGLPVTNAKVIETARALGMRYPPSDAEIIAKAKLLGYTKAPQESRSVSLTPGPAQELSNQRNIGASRLQSRKNSASSPIPGGASPFIYASTRESEARKAEAVKRAYAAEQNAMRSPVRSENTPLVASDTPQKQRLKPQPRRFEIVRQTSVASTDKGDNEPLKKAPLSRSTSHLSPTSSCTEGSIQRQSAQQRQIPAHPVATSSASIMSCGSQTTQSTALADPIASRDRIMTFVTQIVIGDCLYKYTKGPSLSGITGGRHERFFWIHPQTLTIFWDKDNPAFTGSTTTRMPKCGKILSIEQVPDGNPVPPGLYDQSLVIKTLHRDIKITCPNRTRHRVWYQALRYLLEQQGKEQ